MYKLPIGNEGAIALSNNDPTPTFLSAEPSYIETRHVTGVVPSGNSKGSSAVKKKRGGMLTKNRTSKVCKSKIIRKN